jgi:tRNA threonylcarbamoyladenosine biosynthesis protein TsaE
MHPWFLKKRSELQVSINWPVKTNSPEETEEFAREFASSLKGGEVILMQGDLGAGKTTFIRGLALGLGIDDPGEVSSPSYTLINEYVGEKTLIHVDLYRLNDDQEVIELALEDQLDEDTVFAIEWGEKLPEEFGRMIRLRFEITGDESRSIFLD